MAEARQNEQALIKAYFDQIRALRRGDKGAVEKLTAMWDEDGVFEFCGAPPLAATYSGRTAIKTLYQNRLRAKGMEIRLDRESAAALRNRELTLGDVDTELGKVRAHDGKIVAGWSTRIETDQAVGFKVAGSHTFAFKNGKISSLKVVVSPRPEDAPNLKLEGLSVADVGRLATAAWAVV